VDGGGGVSGESIVAAAFSGDVRMRRFEGHKILKAEIFGMGRGVAANRRQGR